MLVAVAIISFSLAIIAIVCLMVVLIVFRRSAESLTCEREPLPDLLDSRQQEIIAASTEQREDGRVETPENSLLFNEYITMQSSLGEVTVLERKSPSFNLLSRFRSAGRKKSSKGSGATTPVARDKGWRSSAELETCEGSSTLIEDSQLRRPLPPLSPSRQGTPPPPYPSPRPGETTPTPPSPEFWRIPPPPLEAPPPPPEVTLRPEDLREPLPLTPTSPAPPPPPRGPAPQPPTRRRPSARVPEDSRKVPETPRAAREEPVVGKPPRSAQKGKEKARKGQEEAPQPPGAREGFKRPKGAARKARPQSGQWAEGMDAHRISDSPSIKQKAQQILAQKVKIGAGSRKQRARMPSEIPVQSREKSHAVTRERTFSEVSRKDPSLELGKEPLPWLLTSASKDKASLTKRAVVKRRPKGKQGRKLSTMVSDFWTDSSSPQKVPESERSPDDGPHGAEREAHAETEGQKTRTKATRGKAVKVKDDLKTPEMRRKVKSTQQKSAFGRKTQDASPDHDAHREADVHSKSHPRSS